MSFSVTSRYHGIKTAKWYDSNNREFIYLQRRFVPPPRESSVQVEHTVTQDERLDNITAKYLADPAQFWRLCDVNNALHPEELTSTIGRRLRIPIMEGF